MPAAGDKVRALPRAQDDVGLVIVRAGCIGCADLFAGRNHAGRLVRYLLLRFPSQKYMTRRISAGCREKMLEGRRGYALHSP